MTLERDGARSAQYYRDVVAAQEEEIAAYEQHEMPAILWPNVTSALTAARAVYSAGQPVVACFAWFDRAVTYWLRYVVEGLEYRLPYFGIIDNHLELYGAARLVGGHHELIETHRRCSFADPPSPEEARLMEQFLHALEGVALSLDDAEVRVLSGVNAGWGLLPLLFKSAASREAAVFGPLLERYLVEEWAPSADRAGRAALKSPKPEYSGKWSFLSAALCAVAGGVPPLSSKAASYLPVELIIL